MMPVWRCWHEDAGGPLSATLSTMTCGRSSLFLCHVLHHEGFEAEWRTGTGDAASGSLDGRVWRSHSWIECGRWIIDITADQFSAPPVIVTAADDPRYRQGEDRAWPEARRRRLETAMALWPLWCEWPELTEAERDAKAF